MPLCHARTSTARAVRPPPEHAHVHFALDQPAQLPNPDSPSCVRVQLVDEIVHIVEQVPARRNHHHARVQQLRVPHHGAEGLALEELVDVLQHQGVGIQENHAVVLALHLKDDQLGVHEHQARLKIYVRVVFHGYRSHAVCRDDAMDAWGGGRETRTKNVQRDG